MTQRLRFATEVVQVLNFFFTPQMTPDALRTLAY